MFIPVESLRDFKKFNIEYSLGFEHVFGYKNEIIKNQKNLVRGAFFHLSKDLLISEFYIPEKPIKEENLKMFYQIFNIQK